MRRAPPPSTGCSASSALRAGWSMCAMLRRLAWDAARAPPCSLPSRPPVRVACPAWAVGLTTVAGGSDEAAGGGSSLIFGGGGGESSAVSSLIAGSVGDLLESGGSAAERNSGAGASSKLALFDVKNIYMRWKLTSMNEPMGVCHCQ